MSFDTQSIGSKSGSDISTLPLARPSYIENPSTRASSFDGDIGTLTLSRPPSYCSEPSTGVTTSPSSRASTVESIKKPTVIFNPSVKYLAAAGWIMFLSVTGIVTMVIIPRYSFVFWLSVILTILLLLVVFSKRGSKILKQKEQERLRRVAEEERSRKRFELPEGHFLVIDEMAQVGHGHSVMTLLPPPPNYENPDLTETVTVVVIPNGDEPNSV